MYSATEVLNTSMIQPSNNEIYQEMQFLFTLIPLFPIKWARVDVKICNNYNEWWWKEEYKNTSWKQYLF
jgi:hypothetical protein